MNREITLPFSYTLPIEFYQQGNIGELAQGRQSKSESGKAQRYGSGDR